MSKNMLKNRRIINNLFIENDWIDMEEAQEVNPFNNIGGHLDNNFLDFDEINAEQQIILKQKKRKKEIDEIDEQKCYKLFNPNGLPWTKATGVGRMHGINTMVNI